MYILVLIIHVLVCVFLIGVILLQGGRGGLSETLGGGTAQSLFGGQVANVLTKVTAGVATVFVVTCLSLAYLSTMRGRSVIEQVPMLTPDTLPLPPGVQSQTRSVPMTVESEPAAPDAMTESAPADAAPTPPAGDASPAPAASTPDATPPTPAPAESAAP
jgi:preprotein translocase subunit SecG